MNKNAFLTLLVILSLTLINGLGAQEKTEEELAEISRQLNNPIGSTWNLVYQDNLTWYSGTASSGDYEPVNTLLFQPVLPIPMGNMNLITRPIVPLVTKPDSPGSSNYVTGIGDITLQMMLGPSAPNGLIWALGLTTTFPTAPDKITPYNDWTVGPTYVLMYMGNPFILGFIGQHWWTYAGDKPTNTSLSSWQYMIIMSLPDKWQLQMTPIVTYDFNDTGSLSFPIGLGVAKTVMIGTAPWSFALEAQYYIASPDAYGAKWNLRLNVKQVLQSPFQK